MRLIFIGAFVLHCIFIIMQNNVTRQAICWSNIDFMNSLENDLFLLYGYNMKLQKKLKFLETVYKHGYYYDRLTRNKRKIIEKIYMVILRSENNNFISQNRLMQ